MSWQTDLEYLRTVAFGIYGQRTELAAALRVSTMSLHNWDSGKKVPGARNQARIKALARRHRRKAAQ